MARKFVLTAEMRLQGPTNVDAVVALLKRKLGSVRVTVDVNVAKSSDRSVGLLIGRLEKLNNVLTQIVTNVQTARANFQQLAAVFNTNQKNISQVNQQLGKTSKTVNSTGRQFQQTANLVEDFGAKSALALKRFTAFTLPASFLLGFTIAVKSGISASIEFQKELVRLSQVTGRPLSGITAISDEVTRLATTLGVSSGELARVSVTLAQAGLSATATQKALEAIAKSELAPTFENIGNTTEGVIAIMQQFGIEADRIEGALSSLNSVAAAFAVESNDIISAVRKTGGAFKAAGGDFNELAALFTSVRQTTRESAETIGTGFRTIFTRLQRPRTIKFLEEFGIALTDLEGHFLGPFEAVQQLSKGLAQIETQDPRFAQIVEELGGFRQVSKVIPLVTRFDVAQRALNVALAGSESLSRDAISAQQAYAVQITKVKEEFLSLFRAITQSDAFKVLLNFILTTSRAVINLTESISGLLPVFGALFVKRAAVPISQFARGFVGQFRSAAQTPVVTPANSQTATALAQNNTQLSNTSAINNLTAAIQRLTVVMGGTANVGAAQRLGRSGKRVPLTINTPLSAFTAQQQVQQPTSPATVVATPSKSRFAGLKGNLGNIGVGALGLGFLLQSLVDEDPLQKSQDKSLLSPGNIGGAITSGVAGAFVGAQLGSFLPGFGTAIGAVTGGLIGLTSSLENASESIRQQTLTQTIEGLSDDLKAIIDGSIIPSSETSGELATAIAKIQSEGLRQAQSRGGFLSAPFRAIVEEIGLDRLFGANFAQSRLQRGRNFINSSISNSDLLNSLQIIAQQIAGQFSSDTDPRFILDQFKKNADNLELFNRTAQVSGLSLNKLNKIILESIEASQDSIAVQERFNNFVDSLAKNNILQRIATAFSELQFSSLDLKSSIDSFSSFLSNSNTQIADISDVFSLNNITQRSTRTLIEQTINSITEPLGGLGEDIKTRILDLSVLKETLPAALVDIASIPLQEGEWQLERRFSERIDLLPIQQELKDQLVDTFKAVQGSASDIKFASDIKRDQDEIAGKLLESIDGASEALSSAVKIATGNINTLLSRIQSVAEESLNIVQLTRNIANQRLSLEEFINRKQTTLPNVEKLLQPFLQQLNELTDGRTADNIANDTISLLQRQAELQTRISGSPIRNEADVRELADVRAALLQNKAGLDALKSSLDEANTLESKLIEIERRRDESRREFRGIFDTAAFGSPKEQRELIRVLSVLNSLNRDISQFADLPRELQGQVLRFVETNNQLITQRFGQEFADDLRQALVPTGLRQFTGQFLRRGDPELDNAATTLEQRIIELRQQGIGALETERNLRNEVNELLRTTALSEFEDGLRRINQLFLDLNIQEAQREFNTAFQRETDALNAFQAGQELLGQDSLFRKFNNIGDVRGFLQSPAIQRLREASEQRDNLQGRINFRFQQSSFEDEFFKRRTETLPTSRGIPASTRNLISFDFEKIQRELASSELAEILDGPTIDRIADQVSRETVGGIGDLIKKLNELIANAILKEIQTAERELNQAGKNAVTASGGRLELGQQVELLKGLDRFINLLSNLPETSTASLEQLTAALKDAAESATQAAQALKSIREPQTRAGGGTIFRRRGTDTVPAMLTPGEFIVNRISAQANAGLLNKINKAKGPLFLQSGGRVRRRFGRNPDVLAARTARFGIGELFTNTPHILDILSNAFGRDEEFTGVLTQLIGGQSREEFDRQARNIAARERQLERQRQAQETQRANLARLNARSPEEKAAELADLKERARISSQQSRARAEKRAIELENQARIRAGRGPQNVDAALKNQILAQRVDVAPARPPIADPFVQPLHRVDNINLLPVPDKEFQGIGDAQIAQRLQDRKTEREKFSAEIRARFANQKITDFSEEIRRKFGKDPRDAAEIERIKQEQAEQRQAARVNNFRFFEHPPQQDLFLPIADRKALILQRAQNRRAARRDILGIASQTVQPRTILSQEERKRNVILNAQARAAARRRRLGFADGGFVSGGIGFGDSVPAVLSRGEFVLNRQAVGKIGAPTLQRFNKGGKVQHLQGGGQIQNSLGGNVSIVNDAMNEFNRSVVKFSDTSNSLVNALNNFTGEISIAGNQQIEVILNGAESLAKIMPDLKQYVEQQISSAISKFTKNVLPYAQPTV